MLTAQRARYQLLALLLAASTVWIGISFPAAAASRAKPAPSATTNPPSVITFSIVDAERGARLLRAVYPRATIRVEQGANAIIVVAPADVVTGMRTIATGIDSRNPTQATVDALQLHNARPREVVARVGTLFPKARFVVAPNRTVIISAIAPDMAQIKALFSAIDTPLASPSPKVIYPAQAIRVTQSDARVIARAVARSQQNVRVAVSGSQILVGGAPEEVSSAKNLIAQLDQPSAGVQYTELYRLRFVDANSVADLLKRSFRYVDVQTDKELNAVTVLASSSAQQRIGDAIAQLDAAPAAAQGAGAVGAGSGGATNTEVVTLRAAVPAVGGAASTSAADIAQSVTQALSGAASDLKITVHPNSTRLILTGSPYSLELAKNLIAQLDTPEPLVELDTEVYEVDEGTQKQLGLKFPTPVLATTYSELPPLSPDGSATTRFLRAQPLTRTALTLQAQLDFLVSTNKARILEDPRITTFSGRTASIRAGETVNILTTTGGGTGTVATTQVQSFQTGVTLDITPVVNSDDYVTVTLHPSVNTEAGISAAGVPNIQTRDTTTTVGLRDGETIVVGGLIEDSNSRTVQKIPFLGDIPLVGRLFQDVGVNHARNEVIVTVTPHIVRPETNEKSGDHGLALPPLPSTPAPVALPTLEAQATIPPMSRRREHPVAAIAAAPLAIPEVAVTASASTTGTATPLIVGPQPAISANPSASPAQSSAPTQPAPLPTAFGQTNVFTFGSAPANNFADVNQPPQIFYVQVQPTVVKNGQPVSISAITSSNVSTLALGPSMVATQTTLASIGPGKWQSTFNFSTAALPSLSGNVALVLTATTGLGANTSIRVPFSLINP